MGIHGRGSKRFDWFDGMAVPLQNYHRRDEIAEWFRQAGCERIHIDDDWSGRALGYAPVPAVAATES